MHAQTMELHFFEHKLLSSTRHYLMEKICIFQVSNKMVSVAQFENKFILLPFSKFVSLTKKLPIKKALNLAFPLAISNNLLSDTFIFGVGTMRNRLFVIILSIPLTSKRIHVAKHVISHKQGTSRLQCAWSCECWSWNRKQPLWQTTGAHNKGRWSSALVWKGRKRFNTVFAETSTSIQHVIIVKLWSN